MRRPHIPVLLDESVTILNPIAGGVYIDGTFGAGQHSEGLLSRADCALYAIDRDIDAKQYADRLAAFYPNKVHFFHGKFGDLRELAEDIGIEEVDGILLDLGVSSMQLDNPEKGFSFMKDGPLKMCQGLNNTDAAAIVNGLAKSKLQEIIHTFGEERHAAKISEAICHARHRKRIETTLELANIIKDAVGRFYGGSIHPATRTFQAIRIAVNDELGELQRGLDAAVNLLKIGGTLVVITFHSLEDSIVKNKFQILTKKIKYNKYKAPDDCCVGREHSCLSEKIVYPSAEEIRQNNRARSAKLRVIRRTK